MTGWTQMKQKTDEAEDGFLVLDCIELRGSKGRQQGAVLQDVNDINDGSG
jgi:hypothetical protein